jgi:hypothetical protein
VKYGLLERNAGIEAGVRKIPTVLMIITDCFVAKHRPGEIRIFVENSSAERCSARELGSKKLHIAMKFGIVKICPSRDRPPPVTPLRKLGNLCSSEVEVAALQLSLYFLSEGFSLVLRPVADWVMNHTVPPPAMLTGSIVGLAPVDWAPQLAPAWLEVNPASAFLEALTDSRLHRL